MTPMYVKQFSPAGTYRNSSWGAEKKVFVDVDMHDISIWHSELVIPHPVCWVRDR